MMLHICASKNNAKEKLGIILILDYLSLDWRQWYPFKNDVLPVTPSGTLEAIVHAQQLQCMHRVLDKCSV